jgi:protein-tyrosine-phosphatase
MASEAPQRRGSGSEGSDDEKDSSVLHSGGKREFTAEERASMLAAQAEEESETRREQDALIAEQKQLAAQITARKVQFSQIHTATPNSSIASASSSSALFDAELTDYNYHEKNRKLVSVLFVEARCDFLAPMAVGWMRKLQAHVLQGSMAAAEQTTAAVDPAAEKAMQEVSVAISNLARPSLSDLVLASPSLAQFKYLVSLDAASEQLLASKFPSKKHIKHSLPRPKNEEEIEETMRKLREFVNELPDLISFLE